MHTHTHTHKRTHAHTAHTHTHTQAHKHTHTRSLRYLTGEASPAWAGVIDGAFWGDMGLIKGAAMEVVVPPGALLSPPPSPRVLWDWARRWAASLGRASALAASWRARGSGRRRSLRSGRPARGARR
jgi:hypothetical protein